MYASAIVVAAGSGTRMRAKTAKPFLRLRGRPLLAHTLAAFQKSPLIGEIVLVVREDLIGRTHRLLHRYRLNKVSVVTAGGDHRFVSVKNGLACLSPRTTMVLVHDAARPFVSERMLRDLIAGAARHGGAIPVQRVCSTVKLAGTGDLVRKTLRRERIFLAQTPQVFRRSVIETAYRQAQERDAAFLTDDAMVVERAGGTVALREGSAFNIKITVPEDLVMARMILTKHKGG